ncbi:MAG: hypothetical protein JSV83_13370 [Desulfobacterales bacterium]|nr:MAG: hypothetical protein JSV83_13370 [Desulfobacterales bacterium]
MKKTIIGVAVLTVIFILNSTAFTADRPKPFGLEVGKSTYEDCIKILEARNWNYQEYEKKKLKIIDEKDPARGKNTFILAKLKDMKGARGIRLFFSNQSILDAIIITLDPDMFVAVMDEMDDKYDLVKKNLMGEDFTDNYTHVLWEKDNIYIELQKLSAHFVRLLYVEKVLYENYKDFLFKPYERFRRQEMKPDWMKEL